LIYHVTIERSKERWRGRGGNRVCEDALVVAGEDDVPEGGVRMGGRLAAMDEGEEWYGDGSCDKSRGTQSQQLGRVCGRGAVEMLGERGNLQPRTPPP